MKSVLKSSFFHLLAIYLLVTLAVSAGLLWKYSLKLDFFAVIIAVLGLFAISEKRSFRLSSKTVQFLVITALLFAIFVRTLPYIDNSVPLGYDAGIYKYVFDMFQESLPSIPEKSLDLWIKSGFPSGIAVMADQFYLFGVSSGQFIIPVYIFLSAITVLPVYLVSKKYFGLEAGIFSAIMFSISLTQLNAFWYLYYRNILALSTMLFAFYFLDGKKGQVPAILFASATGFLHQPTFLMLALVWVAYTITSFRDNKIFLNGLLGLAATGIVLLVTYHQRLSELVLAPSQKVLESVIYPGSIGSGTFYNLFTYQYISLAILPFALLGFLVLLRQKNFNPPFLLFIINGLVVALKLFFFNRLIISLDIAAILLAGFGLAQGIFYSKSISGNLRLGLVILIILSGAVSTTTLSSELEPLINETQLESIKKIPNFTEENASVMATASAYSPWVLGYSKRITIAPGQFDQDLWNENQWRQFWAAGNCSEISALMEVYPKPLYVFVGKHPSSSAINMQKFRGDCFEIAYEDEGGILYRHAG
ncbi:MAG: hypothetical protein JW727_01970 [Candidatus Aenigmarchaeota archaeon]|nr:hypothetical protein [Candidatus Aenigmarchaeota archaeon]